MTDDDIIIEDDDPQPFTVPLPPPPFPGSRDKFLYVRSRGGEAGDKEHEDLMLRRVPRETAMRFRGSAGGRGLTHAQYLAALVELHGRVRARADGGNAELGKLLDELGLARSSPRSHA
jgi:hypothetical protein